MPSAIDIANKAFAAVGSFGQEVSRNATNACACVQQWANAGVQAVHAVALSVIRVISKIFKDTDAVSNVLRLASNGIAIMKERGVNASCFAPLSNSFSGILAFLSAKNIFHKVDSLASGEDARRDVPRGEFNFLRVVSKISMGISDAINGAKWLANVGLIDDRWSKCSASIPVPFFGRSINVNASHAQAGFTIIGSLTNIASTIRKMVREGDLSLKTWLSLASDTSRIASTVLFQIPQCALFGIIAGSVGSVAGLTGFIYDALTARAA